MSGRRRSALEDLRPPGGWSAPAPTRPEPAAPDPEPEPAPPAPPVEPEPAVPEPAPVEEPAVVGDDPVDELVCGQCGAGPHKTLAGLRAHERSHRSDVEKAASKLATALRSLVPGVADELVERLASFVATYEPAAHLWCVATAAGGPWLCHRTEVGRVGERAKAPIVAVPVQLIIDHLRSTGGAGSGAGSGFHAGGAWPHPKARAKGAPQSRSKWA